MVIHMEVHFAIIDLWKKVMILRLNYPKNNSSKLFSKTGFPKNKRKERDGDQISCFHHLFVLCRLIIINIPNQFLREFNQNTFYFFFFFFFWFWSFNFLAQSGRYIATEWQDNGILFRQLQEKKKKEVTNVCY